MADPLYDAMSKENSDLAMQVTWFLLVEEKCVLQISGKIKVRCAQICSYTGEAGELYYLVWDKVKLSIKDEPQSERQTLFSSKPQTLKYWARKHITELYQINIFKKIKVVTTEFNLTVAQFWFEVCSDAAHVCSWLCFTLFRTPGSERTEPRTCSGWGGCNPGLGLQLQGLVIDWKK